MVCTDYFYRSPVGKFFRLLVNYEEGVVSERNPPIILLQTYILYTYIFTEEFLEVNPFMIHIAIHGPKKSIATFFFFS